MAMVRYWLVALLLVLPQAGNAATISTGDDLREVCAAEPEFAQCVRYLDLIYQAAKAIAQMDASGKARVTGACGPDQGIDTVPLVVALRLAWQDYVAAHPERLGDPAAEVALRAFEARWPCRR